MVRLVKSMFLSTIFIASLSFGDVVSQKSENHQYLMQVNFNISRQLLNDIRSLKTSKFDDIHIVNNNGQVKMNNSTYGYELNSIVKEDKHFYDRVFTNDTIMSHNYYGNGKARPQGRVDSAFSLWQERWLLPTDNQSHFQGAFLTYLNNHKKPVAHVVDGFIGQTNLASILADIDFSDSSQEAQDFLSQIRHLNEQSAKGYSQAMLDFSAGSLDYFIGDLRKLKSLTLMQDTYMHQLSFLGYNWGIDSSLGRVIAHSSMTDTNTNMVWAYEAMGYYPFKSKTDREMNDDSVGSINMLKPVDPIQTFQQFGKVGKGILFKLDLHSYFVVQKSFNYSIKDQDQVIHQGKLNIEALSSAIELIDLPLTTENKRLWLTLEDNDGLTPTYLIPVKVNVLERNKQAPNS